MPIVDQPFRPLSTAGAALQSKSVRFLSLAAERLLSLNALDRMYASLPESEGTLEFCERVLEILDVRYRVTDRHLERIPEEGPCVIISNHPFGGIEGVIMAHMIAQRRGDLRILVNRLLSRIPQLRDIFIGVEAFDRLDGMQSNVAPLRDALRWIGQGGALGMFPAGTVSHLHLRERRVQDPQWHPNVVRLVDRTRATVVPLFFHGRNSSAFQIAGLVHPNLRTAMLPKELLKRRGTSIDVHVGNPIAPERLDCLADRRERIDYLRTRTYWLGTTLVPHPKESQTQQPETERASTETQSESPPSKKSKIPAWAEKLTKSPRKEKPIAEEIPSHVLQQEIDSLGDEASMVTSGDYVVFCATADQIPQTLLEIGRLRERTFREVGEGTGFDRDLDRFDPSYRHLFVWHRDKKEVVGSYRMGATDEIVTRSGIDGLYTRSLFDYEPSFIERLGPSLEMGRSFVRSEYQRTYAPLMLLWKGIGAWVVRYPHYRYLFGPASISDEFSAPSKRVMYDYLTESARWKEVESLVHAKRPVPKSWAASRSPISTPKDLNELSTVVHEIESDRLSVPILIREYIRLGARAISFSVDPDFGYTLDVLMTVDLTQTPIKLLSRYLGREGAHEFLDYQRSLRAGTEAS